MKDVGPTATTNSFSHQAIYPSNSLNKGSKLLCPQVVFRTQNIRMRNNKGLEQEFEALSSGDVDICAFRAGSPLRRALSQSDTPGECKAAADIIVLNIGLERLHHFQKSLTAFTALVQLHANCNKLTSLAGVHAQMHAF